MTAQLATIQVQYVNQPREANWSHGNVKDVNKQLWSVRKDRLSYFTAGETCDILWEQTGKYPEIIGKGGQPFPSQQPAPQPGTAAPRNANWPGPPPQPVTTLTYTKDGKQDTPEEIFITGIVGRAMGSGKFEMEQIPELTRIAATAWRNRHQPPVTLSPAESDHSPAGQARNAAPMTEIPMGDPQDPGWS